MKFRYYILILAITVFGTQTTVAQKTTSELPNYILAENASPLIYLYFMQKIKSTTSFGTILMPSKELEMSDFPQIDDAYVNMIASTIEERLQSIGIRSGGYMMLGMSNMSNEELMKTMQESLKEADPYYTMAITIWDWEKVVKKIKKAGDFTLDMQDKAGFSITPLTATTLVESYMVQSCKDLDICMNFLEDEIKSKGADYFSTSVEKTVDIDEMIETSEKFTDVLITENNRKNEWPDESLLKQGKTLVICHSRFKGKNAYKWADDGLTKFYPYPHEMFYYSNMSEINLDEYTHALVPVQKIMEKSKAKTSGVGPDRIKTSIETNYYYVLKDLKTLDTYVGPEPKKVTNFSMSDQPLALRKILKIRSKVETD
jgi:hypothetical protein